MNEESQSFVMNASGGDGGNICGTFPNSMRVVLDRSGMKVSESGICMLPGRHEGPHAFEPAFELKRHLKCAAIAFKSVVKHLNAAVSEELRPHWPPCTDWRSMALGVRNVSESNAQWIGDMSEEIGVRNIGKDPECYYNTSKKGRCKRKPVMRNGMCGHHVTFGCASCGKQATHDCCVNGNLCDNCEPVQYHTSHQPRM